MYTPSSPSGLFSLSSMLTLILLFSALAASTGVAGDLQAVLATENLDILNDVGRFVAHFEGGSTCQTPWEFLLRHMDVYGRLCLMSRGPPQPSDASLDHHTSSQVVLDTRTSTTELFYFSHRSSTRHICKVNSDNAILKLYSDRYEVDLPDTRIDHSDAMIPSLSTISATDESGLLHTSPHVGVMRSSDPTIHVGTDNSLPPPKAPIQPQSPHLASNERTTDDSISGTVLPILITAGNGGNSSMTILTALLGVVAAGTMAAIYAIYCHNMWSVERDSPHTLAQGFTEKMDRLKVEIEDLNTSRAEALQDAERLRSDNDALRVDLRGSRADVENYKTRLQELEVAFSTSLRSNTELSESLNSLQAQWVELHSKLSSSEQEVQRVSSELETEIQKGLARNQQLERRKDAIEKSLRLSLEREITAGQIEAERLENLNNVLQEQLGQVQSAYDIAQRKAADLEARLAISEANIDYWKTELMSCRAKLLHSEKEVSRLFNEVEVHKGMKLEPRVIQLKKLLDISESRCKILRIEAESLRSGDGRLREAERKREEAELTMTKLRDDYEKKRLEEERQAQEKTERERQEKDRVEKILREQEWQRAMVKEEERCRVRDGKQLSRLWTEASAIERFRTVVEEFEKAKFSDTQPLTFASIPWPVLMNPFSLTPKDVQWSDVEKFFEALRRQTDPKTYQTLLTKTQRLFHPDRWSGRGALKTVMQSEIRNSLETTGKRVSQVVTPLWQRNRG
ncbi:hypothetical protein Moror_4422 [Moniliophthora roreri MCA 2997]|uniref:Uncharacterized protein n=1 Tax=Moniliophthora roreri (strain MCA 2997) TaxID=1381753 RepID=V2XI72_MONRO|nr:hypothetical protein Moror_4422 [Moniliophthora roreri MCA 2997]